VLFCPIGAGESGKSTISKQMKIIHLNGFSEAELLSYKPILQSNAIETIKILVNACDELAVSDGVVSCCCNVVVMLL
jgi:guanine nucleotide-binding protein G(i) subunit alpha